MIAPHYWLKKGWR